MKQDNDVENHFKLVKIRTYRIFVDKVENFWQEIRQRSSEILKNLINFQTFLE